MTCAVSPTCMYVGMGWGITYGLENYCYKQKINRYKNTTVRKKTTHYANRRTGKS